MLHEESSKIMTRLKENHRTGKPVNVEEALAKAPDPMGVKEVLKDVREAFDRGGKYDVVEPDQKHGSSFNSFIDKINKEITLQNEILVINKKKT